jgi:hypothetical protein
MSKMLEGNMWDKASAMLGYPRAYIKRQFYLGVYDKIRSPVQEQIVVTVLKLQSPLSVKARTKNNTQEEKNNEPIRHSSSEETKPLP